MRCPSCLSEMSVHAIRGVSIDQCDRCPAIWLDAGERDVLRLASESSAAVAPETFVPSAAPTLRCTACRKGRLQRGRIGQREVLVCSHCTGILVPLRADAPTTSDAHEIARFCAEALCEDVLYSVLQSLR